MYRCPFSIRNTPGSIRKPLTLEHTHTRSATSAVPLVVPLPFPPEDGVGSSQRSNGPAPRFFPRNTSHVSPAQLPPRSLCLTNGEHLTYSGSAEFRGCDPRRSNVRWQLNPRNSVGCLQNEETTRFETRKRLPKVFSALSQSSQPCVLYKSCTGGG